MESKYVCHSHNIFNLSSRIALHINFILLLIIRANYTLAHCRGHETQTFITTHNNYNSSPLYASTQSNVTKKELIAEVASDLGKTQKEVAAVVDTFIQHLVDKMEQNKQVMIPKFGVFSNSLRGERKMRNLQTGEIFTAPPVHVPILRFYDTLKDKVNESIRKGKRG
ncbi:hypothetical protein BmR1_04g09420 [Babesia microti strain RI]|uniref:Integration host factor subunit alpha n=1 Tax=Babesia microti (strain RI) TaxID=1133968 RepID=I7JDW5_BABMR|nr:hypothetical protein BmR1_04g09420 [Babesia microti strain RI]CCF76055.1 hypothetical protein BmR1_04g09420 [Babesia microti strain RI]|eukprot:XP_012650463.1 hypothetical protein BmR1_04g09420 [Babesia microti strain RI]